MAKELKGIIAVLTTPYTNEDQVDYAGFESNIDWTIGKGVHGVLVLGGTGEYVSLSKEERMKITEVGCKKVAGRVPVVVGISAETTKDTIEYAKKAQAEGADAVMLGHPYYCCPNWEMLREHYTKVCASISLPVIMYNNPFTTGVDMGLEHIVELLCEIPNLEYIKDSTGSIQRTRNIRLDGPAKTKILAGWDDLGLEALFAGAKGWICVAANACPEVCVEVYEKFAAGDMAGAWKAYERLLPYLRFLEDGGKLIPASKYATDLRGAVGGPNRAPRLDILPEEKKMVEGYLKDMGLI